jgi:hypothetical protein
MPHVFKPLATITAWILFINGCLGMIGSAVARLAGEAGLAPPIAWGVAVISLIAAVAAMKLRQMLE